MIVKADRAAIAQAARIIRGGGLVAFPTETVYGLGADAAQGKAVARIFEAKGRPRFNPLIVHVADLEAALGLADFCEMAFALARRFWPGPLTLVLPLSARPRYQISELVTAGLGAVAIRIPAHPAARALLEAAAAPIAAPSANKSGRVSPTRAEHVEADFGGEVDMILDGGAAEAGLEIHDRCACAAADPSSAGSHRQGGYRNGSRLPPCRFSPGQSAIAGPVAQPLRAAGAA